jgi:hypothetical protein
VLTDLMFMNRGKIVLDCSMEDFENRYVEVMVRPDQVAAARALNPIQERSTTIRTAAGSPPSANRAPPASPTCSSR